MKKHVFGSVALCAIAWCGTSAAPMLETVENSHFRMTVDPLGARITSLFSKDAGVDFTIPSKSVTIKAGEYTGNVPVTVLYETTGEGFVLELLLSVSDELINSSYGKSSTISVKSDKVTIDWAWLEGSWDAQDWNYYSGGPDGDPYTSAIVKVSETECVVRNLWGSGADFTATVDFDNRTITVPGYQLAFYYAGYSANFYFVAVNPETDYDVYEDLTTPVVGTMSPAGVVFDNYDFLLVGGPYSGYTYAGGLRTNLTR